MAAPTRATWIFLEGALGAGKSTLASALLRRLGHPTGGEGSPTFPLAHEYRLTERPGYPVAHLDLYRLESEEELEMAGLLEHFRGEPGLVMVEWMSKFPALREKLGEVARDRDVAVLDVEISYPDEASGAQEARSFKIRSNTASVLRGNVSRRRSGRA